MDPNPPGSPNWWQDGIRGSGGADGARHHPSATRTGRITVGTLGTGWVRMRDFGTLAGLARDTY